MVHGNGHSKVKKGLPHLLIASLYVIIYNWGPAYFQKARLVVYAQTELIIIMLVSVDVHIIYKFIIEIMLK